MKSGSIKSVEEAARRTRRARGAQRGPFVGRRTKVGEQLVPARAFIQTQTVWL